MTSQVAYPWEAAPVGAAAQRASALSSVVPLLETERLHLRAPNSGDFALWAEIEMSQRAIHIGGPFSRTDAWLDFSQAVAGWILRGHGLWSIERRDDRSLAGFILLNMEYGDFEPEIGYLLAEKSEGHGYATEAARAVAAFATSELGPGRAVSYIDAANLASRRVAEKAGAWLDNAAPPQDGVTMVYRYGTPERAA